MLTLSGTFTGSDAVGATPAVQLNDGAVTLIGTFIAGSQTQSPAVALYDASTATIIGPMLASGHPAVVMMDGASGVIHISGPAYSLGDVAAFKADRWDVLAGYDLAIATQDTQDPPHPVTLVSNPWAVEISTGVTAAARLLATATPQSTGAQIAAAVTA